MKIRIYDNLNQTFFPIYPSTCDIDHLQEKLKRQDGYPMHQIFLVSDGNGIINIGGKTFTLEKNDLFYIKANIPHGYHGTDENFKTSYLSFFGNGFSGIEEYYNLPDFCIFKGKNTTSFEASLIRLFEVFNSTETISGLCSLAFSCVISFFDSAFEKPLTPLGKVYAFIHENYSMPITLDDILEFYPFCKAKLCSDFKKQYGITIFDALTNVRLKHASMLLKNYPHLKLSEISVMCGFSDVSYFCKMYKRKYKLSPKSHLN